jgi:hypothetical protein
MKTVFIKQNGNFWKITGVEGPIRKFKNRSCS